MSGNAHEFIGDIPRHYDQGLGPVLFEDYAADLAQRAAILAPEKVLELAAGTGIVSRALRNQLPSSSHLTVTDLNPPMLGVAQAKFEADENVSFQQADALDLDFFENSFDLLVCQFGVMFFPDKLASYKEAARVLKPGGTYLLSTWGSMDDNPFSRIAYEVSAEFFPDNPPGFYLVPFSCGEPAPIEAGLREAGFGSVSHEIIAYSKTVSDFEAFARGLIYGNPTIDEMGGAEPAKIETMVETLAQRFAQEWGAAPTQMPLKAAVFSARL